MTKIIVKSRKWVGRYFQYQPKNWSTVGHAIETGSLIVLSTHQRVFPNSCSSLYIVRHCIAVIFNVYICTNLKYMPGRQNCPTKM